MAKFKCHRGGRGQTPNVDGTIDEHWIERRKIFKVPGVKIY